MKTILSLICLLSFVTVLNAQKAGTLDSSFGTNGKVLTGFEDGSSECYASALQKDGKILAAGTWNSNSTDAGGFLVARYLTNGTIDSSFGSSGRVIIDFKYDFEEAHSVLVQQDGKIVVSGYGIIGLFNPKYDVLLTRLNTDGSIDTSFGENGEVKTDFGESEYAYGGLLQPDGKIVIVGNFNHDDFLVIRYLPNGDLDSSFADNGKVISYSFGGMALAYCVALDSNNKIIVGGNKKDKLFLTARYNTNGSLDDSFGNNGSVQTNINNSSDRIFGITSLSNGKIIAAGGADYNPQEENMAVVQYLNNGNLDSSFGWFGKNTVVFKEGNSLANSVITQMDGKILLAGRVGNEQAVNFSVARLNSNGIVDSSFGINGKVNNGFGLDNNVAYSIMLQKDGKIITAGSSSSNADGIFDISLARYNNNDDTKKQKIISKIKHWIQNHNNLQSSSTANAKATSLNISIAPNPVNSILTINGLFAINNYQLKIINASGNVVTVKQVSNISSYQINVQGLSAGVYYINIISNNSQSTTLKFIKQ